MNRNTALILTIVAAILCGCPGLLGICWGGFLAIASFIPNAPIDIFGSSDPNTAFLVGIGSLCGGLIFLAIPIVIGVVTLRKKKTEPVPPDEPLPPAS